MTEGILTPQYTCMEVTQRHHLQDKHMRYYTLAVTPLYLKCHLNPYSYKVQPQSKPL